MTTQQDGVVNSQRWSTVSGDGGEAPLSAEELQKFKTELNHVARTCGWNVNQRRFAGEETRFNLWEGQSPDGRKHREALGGHNAFPFEGASDARIRLADAIVNERVMTLVAAAMRNRPAVNGLELNNAPLGKKLTTVLHWVLANKLGAHYVREIVKLAQYQEGDSPAGGVLGVWWEQETALENQTVTRQGLMAQLSQMGVDPQKLAELDAQLMNPERDAETAEGLQQLLPHLSLKRAKQAVGDLRETGQATVPHPYLRLDAPQVRAYRLFDDIFLPTNTVSDQRCRCWFLREWLSEAELRERIVSDGYDEAFVTEALKHEAQTGFPQYRRNLIGEMELVTTQENIDQRRGLYEIWTAMYRAVNDDNVPGIYWFTFHHAVEFAGTPRRLLDYLHGQYPFVWFGREILSSRLMDSRGVPELAATDQYSLKLLHDAFMDYTSLATVPPIKVPANRGRLRLVLGPLKLIEERRPGEISFMQPPVPVAGNPEQQQLIQNRVNEYFGRIAENVPPTLTQLHVTHMVTLFLASLTDAMTQVLQLCQQYLSDEDLAQITGDDGQPIARSRQEIQGKFRVELSYDPRTMDLAYVKEVAALIGQVILPIDTLSVVQRDALVRWLFMAINPWLATHSIAPTEQAQQAEIKDEEDNFTKINAGIEPPMVPAGLNFPLRLQVLLGIPQKNPEAFQKLTPVSRKIYEARVKYLQNQVQQIKNAQIGRQVGQPALGEGPAGMSAAAGGPTADPNA